MPCSLICTASKPSLHPCNAREPCKITSRCLPDHVLAYHLLKASRLGTDSRPLLSALQPRPTRRANRPLKPAKPVASRLAAHTEAMHRHKSPQLEWAPNVMTTGDEQNSNVVENSVAQALSVNDTVQDAASRIENHSPSDISTRGKHPRSSSTPPVYNGKKYNKLGYIRRSVACSEQTLGPDCDALSYVIIDTSMSDANPRLAPCRRRKIRCLSIKDGSQQRCGNCIRLQKQCAFYPVDEYNVSADRPQSSDKLGAASFHITDGLILVS